MCRSEDGTRLGVPPHNSRNNSKEGVGFNLQLALFYPFQLKPFSIFSRKNRNLVFLPLLCYVPPVFPRASYRDIFTPPFSNYTPRLLSPMMMTIDYPLKDFHIKKSEHVSHISLYSINPRPQWVNQSVSDICHLRRRLSMRSPRWSIINKVHRNLLLLANHWGGGHNENPSTGNGKSSNSKQLYTYKCKKRREFKCLKHCGFCSNRILLYFPLSVRPSVWCDISHIKAQIPC